MFLCCGASVTTVLSFRFYFALILIWGYIFIRRIDFKLSRKQIIMLLFLGGFFYSGSAITLFASFKYISAGLADVLIFTYPSGY
ncbi:EamA family transporter [Fervidicella metallireducens]